MNHFSCSLQGPESNFIDFSIKLIAFTQKLDLWIKNIQHRQFGMFENVALQGSLVLHLVKRSSNIFFCRKMKSSSTSSMMVMHLHSKSIHCQAWRSPTNEQEELIDLQCDEGVQEKFKNHKMAEFRLNVSPSYQALAKNAIPQLLIFLEVCMDFLLFLQSSRSKKSSRKPRALFTMFCEQNISATCETSRRKASLAIALT